MERKPFSNKIGEKLTRLVASPIDDVLTAVLAAGMGASGVEVGKNPTIQKPLEQKVSPEAQVQDEKEEDPQGKVHTQGGEPPKEKNDQDYTILGYTKGVPNKEDSDKPFIVELKEK